MMRDNDVSLYRPRNSPHSHQMHEHKPCQMIPLMERCLDLQSCKSIDRCAEACCLLLDSEFTVSNQQIKLEDKRLNSENTLKPDTAVFKNWRLNLRTIDKK